MIPVTQLRKIHLVGLLLFFVVLTLSTYINRFPTGDDAWFGEQSYWLEKEGIIRSEFFKGIVGRFLKVYSLALLVSFWLITKANAGMYLVLFIPFMLILTYELYRLEPVRHNHLRWLLGLYFVIGIFGSVQLIRKNISLGYLSRLPLTQTLKIITGRTSMAVLRCFCSWSKMLNDAFGIEKDRLKLKMHLLQANRIKRLYNSWSLPGFLRAGRSIVTLEGIGIFKNVLLFE
ncbi:hypothetical protein [Dyadobacter fanqingshengii]|uniref:Uncharacterized protein n=1 Tax=Dyadobacter fanqingshengii TaxID=2906443 RepID=A0A9X1P4L5_9BACT|nr:hypothetical protein [Dyadobacter fanqingshengii]MCF0038731.1 hypothetical protein [Dyadobacter fanqingshengii]USJ34437.1 hypothetical protein NFI81_17185 [Dyadobacter fanqingshengii]